MEMCATITVKTLQSVRADTQNRLYLYPFQMSCHSTPYAIDFSERLATFHKGTKWVNYLYKMYIVVIKVDVSWRLF